jgi:hypothetical protein
MLPWWSAVADVSNAPEKANRSFGDSHDCHCHGRMTGCYGLDRLLGDQTLSTLENQLRHLDLSAKSTPHDAKLI